METEVIGMTKKLNPEITTITAIMAIFNRARLAEGFSSILVPQLGQKKAFSGSSLPHFRQYAIPDLHPLNTVDTNLFLFSF